MRWNVPADLDAEERRLAAFLAKKGKFYVFLRQIRHRLFDESLEQELERAYGKARGKAPLPAALLAMVTLLQAYTQVGDAEAVETAAMDRRWQFVLGCLGATKAPFSQGALVDFRRRMIEHDLDQRLLDRTVELAKETGLFGWKNLRLALDSSPLIGAGKVQDSWNLVGRALSAVVDCASACFEVPREQILAEAGLKLLSGSSLKAQLDIDWDDADQQSAALNRLLDEVAALEVWVSKRALGSVKEAPLQEALNALWAVIKQDFEPDPFGGGPKIRRGTARDRMPSLGDPEMRHGRKSRSQPFTGYKRHLIKVLGADIVLGALAAPANKPEHEALEPLLQASERHGQAEEVKIDRGYLGSPAIGELREQGTRIVCKPWPVRNHGRFTKADFAIDLASQTVTCPAGETVSISPASQQATFGAATCSGCELKPQCTVAAGRTVSIHPQEALMIDLRRLKSTPDGRAELRERVEIEHSLARLGAVQGKRARYKGERKNTLDTRRCAAIGNLHAVAKWLGQPAAQAS